VILDRCRPLKWALHRLGILSDAHMAPWPREIVREDVCRGLSFADATVEAIYSSHMLEHLYYEDAARVLREFRRVLSADGVLRLALPDSERLAREFVAALDEGSVDATDRFNEELNAHPLRKPVGVQRFVGSVGASSHRWQPTRALVIRMLREAGFETIEERTFLEGDLPELSRVETRPESIFVEAKRGAPCRGG